MTKIHSRFGRRWSALTLASGLLVLLCGASLRAEDEPGVASSKRTWRDYISSGRQKSPPEERRSKIDSSEQLNPEGMVDLIDSPTPYVIDYGAFRLNFRVYSQGGLLSHISFGVFRRLNIGASWDNEKLVGSDDPKTHRPTINAKFRIYDGGEILPAFAIGYDGQGRFFDEAADEYRERDRGLFFTMGREILIPKLEAYGGVNITQFKEGIVLGSVGLSYTIEDRLVLMTEYDNIRNGPDNRWNAGFRVFALPSLAIDFAVRRIASNQEKERILRINYVGSF